MNFRTEIDISPLKSPFLTHESRIMTLGSCFADEIGKHLKDCLFNVLINPQGVLFNPLSVATAIENISDLRLFKEKDLTYDGVGLWHSFQHHGSYSSRNKLEILNKINSSLKTAHEFLKKENLIVCITLGSARIFSLKETDIPVANCHKFPSDWFSVKDLCIEEIKDSLLNAVLKIKTINKKTHVIFTVSPIRHKAYGLHQDKLSKAKLLLAVDKICNEIDDCYYFPAYEILLDDLRDYRFYNDDMVHPSKMAVEYVFECFQRMFVPKNENQVTAECIKLAKRLSHRQINKAEQNSSAFNEATLSIISSLIQRYPHLKEVIDDFRNEQ